MAHHAPSMRFRKAVIGREAMRFLSCSEELQHSVVNTVDGLAMIMPHPLASLPDSLLCTFTCI